MSLPQDLLDKLACPRCRGSLTLLASGFALDCAACELRFAIEDGIPNLLEDEATPLDGGAAETDR
jgi:uncharacterized protein YbaR (Trm112 family)